jgi:hypothetical protein
MSIAAGEEFVISALAFVPASKISRMPIVTRIMSFK